MLCALSFIGLALSLRRAAQVLVGDRAKEPWLGSYVLSALLNLSMSTLALTSVVLARLHMFRLARGTVASMFGCWFLNDMQIGPYELVFGQGVCFRVDGALGVIEGVVYGFLAIASIFEHKLMCTAVFSMCLMSVVYTSALCTAFVLWGCPALFHSIYASIWLAALVIFMSSRLKLIFRMRAAHREVAEDWQRYDKAWNQIVKDEGPKLEFLASLVCVAMTSMPAPETGRQSCKAMHEIYKDAIASATPFHIAVQTWADETAGLAITGHLKKRRRAMEKVRRIYAGDKSRLVDILRGSIVYEDVGALSDGFSTIMDEAKVVRVKHRLSLECDGVDTVGYRDVCLNLAWPLTDGRYHIA